MFHEVSSWTHCHESSNDGVRRICIATNPRLSEAHALCRMSNRESWICEEELCNRTGFGMVTGATGQRVRNVHPYDRGLC